MSKLNNPVKSVVFLRSIKMEIRFPVSAEKEYVNNWLGNLTVVEGGKVGFLVSVGLDLSMLQETANLILEHRVAFDDLVEDLKKLED